MDDYGNLLCNSSKFTFSELSTTLAHIGGKTLAGKYACAPMFEGLISLTFSRKLCVVSVQIMSVQVSVCAVNRGKE